MRNLFLEHRKLILFISVILSVIVGISVVVWYHVSLPKVLVDGRVVLTSNSNEARYSLYLQEGDIVRIQIKVSGDPVNLYIFDNLSSSPLYTWEDVFSDKRHQGAGSPCTECSPLSPDKTFCYRFPIQANQTYTFRLVTTGDHSEFWINIAIVAHGIIGWM